jgi:heme/copper-type cytochrome/quinol oxidase subunit 3
VGARIAQSVDPDQRRYIASAVFSAIHPGRTNMSTYDLMVIAAVLLSFSSFSAVLAFATFDESRRRHAR